MKAEIIEESNSSGQEITKEEEEEEDLQTIIENLKQNETKKSCR